MHRFLTKGLREKIQYGTLGLPPLELLGEGGPDLHSFLLGDTMPCLDAMDCETIKQKTVHKGIENSKSQDLQRQVVKNAFGILMSRFRVLLGTMEQRPKVVRDIVFTCVVLHHMLGTHQVGADRASTPANNLAALQNEQVVYTPGDNHRNPSREAKRQ